MQRKPKGFTLIELLVVIAIVAVLIGLIQPTIVASQRRAKRMKVQADVQSLVTAWKNYYGEYRRWPIIGDQCLGQDADEGGEGIDMEGNIIEYVLMPGSRVTPNTAIRTYNPKLMQFLTYDDKVINEDKEFVDPWGNMIKVLFDLNANGKIDRSTFPVVYDTVIAWSAGPDGRFGETDGDEASQDDIRSWD